MEVTVFGPLLHGLQTPHTPVAFEATALINDGLAGALFRSSQHASDHHAVATTGQRLGDVTRVANAAVGDQRNVSSGQAPLPLT